MPQAAPGLAGLLALALLVGSVNGIARVAMPLYTASLGAQPWLVGLAGGFGYAGLLLLALPMGSWMERHGSRRLFVRGTAAAALVYLVLAAARAPWQAVAMIAAVGLTLPLRTMPVHTEFLAMLPGLSISRAGWNRAAHMSGLFLIGPTISAAAIAAAGFRAVLALSAAGMLAAAIIGARVLGRVSLHGRQGRQPPLPPGARLRSQLELVRGHAGLRRTMGVDFLTQMTVAYFVVFGVALAVRDAGMTQQSAIALVTLQGCAYVLTLLLGGAPLARSTRQRGYLAALTLLMLPCALFWLVPSPPVMWLGAALMGAGMGLQGLLNTGRFAELLREHGSSRIVGLGAIAPPAGGVIGGVVGGQVSQHLGAGTGFLLLALGLGTAAAMVARRPSGW